jgi:predicted transcriptional regulator
MDDLPNLPEPQDLEIAAVKAGISMTEACLRAKVSPAVFHRWKRGKNPGYEHIRAIIAVLKATIREKTK